MLGDDCKYRQLNRKLALPDIELSCAGQAIAPKRRRVDEMYRQQNFLLFMAPDKDLFEPQGTGHSFLSRPQGAGQGFLFRPQDAGHISYF